MSGRDTAVLFVGAATYDAIALVDGYPAADERRVARDVVYAGGGPAATAAVAAARLGRPAQFLGVVGADDEGRAIVAGLEDEGVDVSGVVVDPARRSGASVIVVDGSAGSRAICTRPVPPLDLPAAALERLAAADWVHVDHLGWPVLDRVRRRSGRPRVSVDGGNPIPGLRLAEVDLYVPTEARLAATYGDRPAGQLVDAALADGARCVVATRGAAGCVGGTADGRRAESAGHPVEVVSTLGAGDVFHGALLAAVVRGDSLEASLDFADAAAAASCRGLDGRSAIPRLTEVPV